MMRNAKQGEYIEGQTFLSKEHNIRDDCSPIIAFVILRKDCRAVRGYRIVVAVRTGEIVTTIDDMRMAGWPVR